MENVKNKELAEKAEKMLREMFTRYANQAKEANEAAVRVVFDAKTGETGVEFALSAKPGTSLAADIAARKPNTNRFAGLIGPASAVGLKYSFPALGQEFRDLMALAIQTGSKEALVEGNAPEPVKPLLKELADGTVRTVQSGPIDLAVGLNGPDDRGTFTAVAAISFEDTSKLEKELRSVVKEQAPPEIQDLVKFDAARVGSVGIHAVKIPPDQVPPEVVKLFGENVQAALAFAPKGIYFAVGPDPVGALKTALTQEPQPARVFDLAVNPSRLRKLVAAANVGDEANKFLETIGERDELYTIFFVEFEGGTELRARVGFNLKLAAGVGGQVIDRHGPGAVVPGKDR
jgi:hypothetical protein